MNYEERLQHVSVLGAAGKMGSGILLLTAVEVADLSLKPENKGKAFVLNAVDVSREALSGLMGYLRVQVQKLAEKKMVQLRGMYADRADLIENLDIVEAYVDYVLSLVSPTTRLEAAYDSTLVFEAIKEDPAVKVKVLSSIDTNNPNKPWYFTNTSSIPIGELDTAANLGGRIIGFHFYNPPAVQKLVEVIKSQATLPEVEAFALQYAKNLRKTVVPSNDIAGFVGNGHFMRDLLHGIKEVEALVPILGFSKSVYVMNKVSQDYLVRPMGIFQLIDYVGLDVCQYILSVMQPHMSGEKLHSDLLDSLIAKGVKGGQYSDGSQKDGFLKYEKGRPVAVFNPDKAGYDSIGDFQAECDAWLGATPAPAPAWKNAVREVNKEGLFRPWFGALKNHESEGSRLAVRYAQRSCEIGKKLVADGVAKSDADVNTVMLTGFFHAYGPINDYV